MAADTDIVTGWFVLNSGFKVQARCPHCHSHHISYHKVRRPGLKGISAFSKGLTPACLDCGKNLPTQTGKGPKQAPAPKRSARVRS